MSQDQQARGGATIGVLNRMEPWEANLILNLRLWCEGPDGQAEVWNDYRKALTAERAQCECRAFEVFLRVVFSSSHRPLVRHGPECACVGADEGILAHLVRTASDGHLNDAALIATLMVGPAQAERVAMMAGQVGATLRLITSEPPRTHPEATANVVRLH